MEKPGVILNHFLLSSLSILAQSSNINESVALYLSFSFSVMIIINILYVLLIFLFSCHHKLKLSVAVGSVSLTRYLLETRWLARVSDQGDAVADDGDVLDEDAERRVFVGWHLDDVDVQLAEELRQGQVLRPSLVQRYLAPRA